MDWDTRTSEIPDSIEPVIAARAWRVTPRIGGVRGLRSTGQREAWPMRDVMQARCLKGNSMWTAIWFPIAGETTPSRPEGNKHGAAPDPYCECGIWGLSDVGYLLGWDFGDHPLIHGVVQMWGHIVAGSHGWRAEYARPVAVVRRSRKRVRPVEAETAAAYGLQLVDEWPALSPSIRASEGVPSGHR